MKINKLLGFVLLTMVAFKLHAYGSNVTLLSSKIERSPGLVGGFIEVPIQQQLNDGKVSAYAQANASFGRKNDNIGLSGEHGYLLVNKTNRPQIYSIEYKLSLADGRFIRQVDTVRVQQNSVDRGASRSYTYQLFTQAGTFDVHAETSIRGDMSDYKIHKNYVNVSN